jgi:hypothetical protein
MFGDLLSLLGGNVGPVIHGDDPLTCAAPSCEVEAFKSSRYISYQDILFLVEKSSTSDWCSNLQPNVRRTLPGTILNTNALARYQMAILKKNGVINDDQNKITKNSKRIDEKA